MKINKSKLLKALEQPARIVGNRTRHLLGILISAKNGQFVIEATDLDQSCMIFVECDGDLDPICVSLSVFHVAVSFSVDEIEINQVGAVLEYRSGQIGVKIQTTAADIFPRIKYDGKLVILPADELARGIRSCKFFADKNADRQVLMAAHVVGSANLLQCESSRGSQISVKQASVICGDFNILIPSAFIHAVADALDNQGAELLVGESALTIQYPGGCYNCKLAEGTFPNTDPIMFGEREMIGIIDRNQWTDTFRCLKAIRDESEALMVRTELRFEDKQCTVTAVGTTPYKRVIEGNFKPEVMFVNAITFLECLTAFPEDALLKFESPAVAKAVRLEHEGYVVMTCRLIE